LRVVITSGIFPPDIEGPATHAAEVRALELGDRIRLLGPISHPQVRLLLDAASCLVLPSRSEGFGRVILEAMARARPVVAAHVGGIPELVDNGRTGMLVPPDDPQQLASALVLILKDADLRQSMGEEGRREVLKRDPIREYESGMARLAAWVENRR